MFVEYAVICLSAAVAGAVNSIAGGGTLLTFPVLELIETALHGSTKGPVIANATSTVALFPGSLAAMWGYRAELRGSRHWVKLLLAPSIGGGLLGTVLVIRWPEFFGRLVPWLIFTAALLFLLQPQIARWTGIGRPHEQPGRTTLAGVVLFQFLVALYGGYFGAGIGILMLAALAMMGLGDIHQMNALKTLFASAINGISVVIWIGTGYVDWPRALPMVIAAIIGGYGGAHVARRMNRTLVRGIVVGIGFALAAFYFYRQWAG